MKVDVPRALKVCPDATVAPPLKVASPVAVKALLIVLVPVASPIKTAVASPPILSVVALVLKRLAVALVVVISPPLIAISNSAVTSPERVDVPSIVKVLSA